MSRGLPTRDAFNPDHHPSNPPHTPYIQTLSAIMTTKTKRKGKKRSLFNISTVTFDPSIIFHSLRFFLLSLDLTFFRLNFSFFWLVLKKCTLRLVSFDLTCPFFYDVPSSHVFSLFFILTVHPYFIPDSILIPQNSPFILLFFMSLSYSIKGII